VRGERMMHTALGIKEHEGLVERMGVIITRRRMGGGHQ